MRQINFFSSLRATWFAFSNILTPYLYLIGSSFVYAKNVILPNNAQENNRPARDGRWIAFLLWLPFQWQQRSIVDGVASVDSDTTVIADELYGFDRLEDVDTILSDDYWLPEVAVAGEATEKSLMAHGLDTVAYADWSRIASSLLVEQPEGVSLWPLHPSYNLQIVRPEGCVFPVFSHAISQYAAYREWTWTHELPIIPEECETQMVTVFVVNADQLAQLSTHQLQIKEMVSQQQVVFALLGVTSAGWLSTLGTPVVSVADESPTAQALLAEALFGAVQVRSSNGAILAAKRLGHAPPEYVGIDRARLEKMEKYIHRAIRSKAFPGCQVLVAKSGTIVYDRTFGYHTYHKEQAVNHSDVYDLASITKVAATTLGAIWLHGTGRLAMEKRISDYTTTYDRTGLKYLRVSHLLSHHSGLQSNLPIAHWLRQHDLLSTYRQPGYDTELGKDLFLKNGVSDSLKNEIRKVPMPRKGYFRYSDVNFILLQQLVEQQAGTPLDQLLDGRIYSRLGVKKLMYRPGLHLPEAEIVPTERDKTWRKALVHGEVHDESAMLLGGVGGHAGLFGNARDLAVIFQMLLNEGSYGGDPILTAESVRLFTHKNRFNYRALGFDRLAGHSRSLRQFGASDDTFGHTGFTGTCVWADPENDLIFIFLSNRIYPDKHNDKLQTSGLRERLHLSWFTKA
ncbi:MAG: serine hydrolase [Saprospiraceae bacterium]